MPTIRVSDEQMGKKREAISRLKSEIQEREVLVAQKDSPLWKILGPGIKQSIQANTDAIAEILAAGSQRKNNDGSFETVDPMADFAVLKSLGGAVKAWKHIVESVEVEEVIERKKARLHELTEELKRIETEQA